LLLGPGCAVGVATIPDAYDADVEEAGVLPDAGGAKDTGAPKKDASSSDATVSDAPVDAPVPGCLCTQGCGSCPNVAQVQVDQFRIDSIEVTNLHYAAFLAAKPTTQHLPAACASNDFTPTAQWPAPSGKESHPVTHVDWCDAFAYCRWAGKRLCGAVGGGSTDYAGFGDATRSQWYRACSASGARAFPYGGSYQPQACNGADVGAGAARSVGASSTCVGGYSSLFDMSGNVWEWEDSCSGDNCRIRGGSFANSGSALSCGADAALPRGSTGAQVGFRCCAP
jgi:formylglycine-generating enzyme required for sulfatase activity